MPIERPLHAFDVGGRARAALLTLTQSLEKAKEGQGVARRYRA